MCGGEAAPSTWYTGMKDAQEGLCCLKCFNYNFHSCIFGETIFLVKNGGESHISVCSLSKYYRMLDSWDASLNTRGPLHYVALSISKDQHQLKSHV